MKERYLYLRRARHSLFIYSLINIYSLTLTIQPVPVHLWFLHISKVWEAISLFANACSFTSSRLETVDGNIENNAFYIVPQNLVPRNLIVVLNAQNKDNCAWFFFRAKFKMHKLKQFYTTMQYQNTTLIWHSNLSPSWCSSAFGRWSVLVFGNQNFGELWARGGRAIESQQG